MSEAVKLRKKHKPNTLNINVHNPDKKIEQDVMSLAREIPRKLRKVNGEAKPFKTGVSRG